MINLTLHQREFLDCFYTEYLKSEFGPATRLAADRGFYYEHFKALFEFYRRAWGKDWDEWEGVFPPTPISSQLLIFPWDSVEVLEVQLKGEGVPLVLLPRMKSISQN